MYELVSHTPKRKASGSNPLRNRLKAPESLKWDYGAFCVSIFLLHKFEKGKDRTYILGKKIYREKKETIQYVRPGQTHE